MVINILAIIVTVISIIIAVVQIVKAKKIAESKAISILEPLVESIEEVPAILYKIERTPVIIVANAPARKFYNMGRDIIGKDPINLHASVKDIVTNFPEWSQEQVVRLDALKKEVNLPMTSTAMIIEDPNSEFQGKWRLVSSGFKIENENYLLTRFVKN